MSRSPARGGGAWSSPERDGDPASLILLAPITPAPTGNGLAMRVELFRRAAPPTPATKTVVVPVAGRLPDGVAAPPGVVVVTADPGLAHTGMRALLAEPVWRERLTRAGTLPRRARAASPGLAEAVVQALAASGPVTVHVMRSYLAPLGTAVAERLQAVRVTLDLDEDDAGLAATLGDAEAAASYERLLGVFGPLFDRISAASAIEAEAIGRRHRLVVDHVPNAVELPPQSSRRPAADRRRGASLLFVGNLTYAPNIEAARVLVEKVMPLVQRRLRDRVHVTLVGQHHPALRSLAGPTVDIAGFVSDLGPLYADADAVVVPLRAGAGTRIKLLEAFAHGVPVVASGAAAAGLEVTDGHHLLLAEDPERIATAIKAILDDPALAKRLGQSARRLVRDRYCTDAVIPVIRAFLGRPAARTGPGGQPSGAP